MPGDSILFYSDGEVEVHNPQREMFTFRGFGGWSQSTLLRKDYWWTS
jgi:serine phosphatase RsbU (regulator of sigma subunit)